MNYWWQEKQTRDKSRSLSAMDLASSFRNKKSRARFQTAGLISLSPHPFQTCTTYSPPVACTSTFLEKQEKWIPFRIKNKYFQLKTTNLTIELVSLKVYNHLYRSMFRAEILVVYAVIKNIRRKGNIPFRGSLHLIGDIYLPPRKSD